MEHTHKTYIYVGLALIVGVVIGWCIAHAYQSPQGMRGRYTSTESHHMMPDGSTMEGMDMNTMMKSMNANLQGKTGDAFDREFVAEMIVHHQGAIDMATLALTNAKHQELKDLATAIIKAQTTEITQMKQWQKIW